ncbi:unnamed protein product, partial [Iphiclides podalirius]
MHPLQPPPCRRAIIHLLADAVRYGLERPGRSLYSYARGSRCTGPGELRRQSDIGSVIEHWHGSNSLLPKNMLRYNHANLIWTLFLGSFVSF